MKEKLSTMMDDDEDEDMKHCLTLRIWSLNTAMRGTLNDEHFRKGHQVDEWLRQASKGESKMYYTNMDARSTGMFWAMSYMTGQPPIMVIREVNPVPISLLSGLSIHMCLKLSSQLEETMFSGQAVASIALVEMYARLLLIAPHSLFPESFPGRTDVQCLHRWQKEDDHIIELVQRYGSRKWSAITKYLPGRIGKQCRKSVIPLTNTKKRAKQSRWRSEFKENVKIRSKIEELDFVI
ncbi:hypothetical protein POM88_007608 [Heracleum sosnowskyi]|uniref:Myb-like domain-containing protein n=1 Tax=Heracleum sosnowskyi TaxID=360622 RepID=A0AAD8J4Q6_9APIA|nr:hypothetical protein POM88_007608 [Heracleum sosnowskyi]